MAGFMNTPYDISTGADMLLGVGVVVGAVFIGVIVRLITERAITARNAAVRPATKIFFGRIIFAVCVGLGALAGLQVAGIELHWFAGALGIGFGFASKNIVSNFVAGIILLTQETYGLGDQVVVGGVKGSIKEFGIRATSIKMIDGGDITVPNIDFLTSTVLCYTKNPVRRLGIPFRIGRSTDVATVTARVLAVIKAHPKALQTPEPSIVVVTVGSYAVELEARIWVESHGGYKKLPIFTQLIVKTLREAHIDIPYPVQTLRVDHTSSDLLADRLAMAK